MTPTRVAHSDVLNPRHSRIRRHCSEYQPTANQYQGGRQHWSQYGIRHTSREITTKDYARRRADEQRCQQWPINRPEEPMADAGYQGQRNSVRNIGPDDN